MQLIRITEQNNWIEEIKSILKKGGIVAYPTDTCYALGALTNNNDAVTKLLSFKEKSVDRSVPFAVSSVEMMQKYLEMNENTVNFVRNFTPGAVSIVAKSTGNVDTRLEAENSSLSARIPNFAEILELIDYLGQPITTTIASTGGFTPYSVESILQRLPESKVSLIDAILDPGYELPHNPPSTVLDFTSEELVVHRTGRINPTELKFIKEYESSSVEETIETGKAILNEIMDVNTITLPKIILLDGQMGAGKTHLTKGIAEALGIERVVKSPTYNYINEYKIQSEADLQEGKLIHVDAWRIKELEDLNRLGLKEYFVPGNVVVIEWGSVISALDPKFFDALHYYLCEIVIEGDRRKFKLYSKN